MKAEDEAKAKDEAKAESWPKLPTETEIYILPDGTVVVADMPMELADLASELGIVLPCEIPAIEEPEKDG